VTRLARVAELWVFPVKSMAGALLGEAEVTGSGLAGDRSWAVVDEGGAPVTARQEPRLREVAARLVDGQPALDVPGHPAGLTGVAATKALSAWLGRPVRLEHRADGGFVDVAPVHLVSTAAIRDAAHAEECDACDVAAPRANVVVDLDAGSEREWVGREVAAGSSALTVVRLPKHCLGVYAEVTHPGLLRVGDDLVEA